MQTFNSILMAIRHKRPTYNSVNDFYNRLNISNYRSHLSDRYGANTVSSIIKLDSNILFALKQNPNIDLINAIEYYKNFDSIKKQYMKIISLPWDNETQIKLKQIYSQIKF